MRLLAFHGRGPSGGCDPVTIPAKNLPGVADRMAARQVENLQRDEPPRAPDGTLYHPGESGHVHGDHAQA